MRIPNSEHTRRPWRIHEVAPDFLVEDVWSYRTLAGRIDTLRDRLPEDMRQDACGEPVPRTPFTMVYECSPRAGQQDCA